MCLFGKYNKGGRMKYLLGGIVVVLMLDAVYQLLGGWYALGIVSWIAACGVYILFFTGASTPAIDEWEKCDNGHYKVAGQPCKLCVMARSIKRG